MPIYVPFYIVIKDTKFHQAYKKSSVTERHRNKHTFDKKYSEIMKQNGLIISAVAEDDDRIEAFEWENHKWGIGVQYHPEFISRPAKPHPLFTAFLGAALNR